MVAIKAVAIKVVDANWHQWSSISWDAAKLLHPLAMAIPDIGMIEALITNSFFALIIHDASSIICEVGGKRLIVDTVLCKNMNGNKIIWFKWTNLHPS